MPWNCLSQNGRSLAYGDEFSMLESALTLKIKNMKLQLGKIHIQFPNCPVSCHFLDKNTELYAFLHEQNILQFLPAHNIDARDYLQSWKEAARKAGQLPAALPSRRAESPGLGGSNLNFSYFDQCVPLCGRSWLTNIFASPTYTNFSSTCAYTSQQLCPELPRQLSH